MPISGATPTLLTGSDANVTGVWQAAGGLYGQAVACGTAWIVKLANGQQTDVPVPGVNPDYATDVLGSYGNSLEVFASLSCDSSPAMRDHPTTSLMWFNPATNVTTQLLGPTVNGGWVDDAVAYPSSSQG
jgi:TolB protein